MTVTTHISLRLIGSAIVMALFSVSLVIGLSVVSADEHPVVYVSVSAPTDTGDGTSWAEAFRDLQDGLAEADAQISNGASSVELWVATGTYFPHDSDRGVAFELRDNVAIYGGFDGTETERNQRDWGAIPTILSGDINDSGNLSGNSYTIVYAENVGNSAVLDGFTVSGGQAMGDQFGPLRGTDGAGVFLDHSDPILANLIVTNNEADFGGGGIYIEQGSPTFVNVLISGNRARFGAGVLIQGSSGLDPIEEVATFVNVTITGNLAVSPATSEGGGVNISRSAPTFTNSIIWGNEADEAAEVRIGGMGIDPPRVTEFNYSIVRNGCPDQSECSNLITTDPEFANAENASAAPTADGDYRLQETSPAIDAGINQAFSDVANGLDRDLDGNSRFAGPAEPFTIDLGPYEFQVEPDITPLETIYVDASNDSGDVDGSSWEHAFTDLQDGLELAGFSTQTYDAVEVLVAAGTYRPADIDSGNRNATFAVPDGVTIYGGFPESGGDFDSRDPEQHETLLSGNLGDQSTNDDNSYTVVTIESGAETTIDGVTITGGNADESTGDGLSPALSGGGVHSRGTLNLVQVTISDNSATRGGGIYGSSAMTISSSTISGNTASDGGGIYGLGATTTITSSTISGNTATFRGGGIASFTDRATTVIISSTISGNTAELGGGIYGSSTTTTVIGSSILVGNAGDSSPDIDGPVTDGSYNLIGQASVSGLSAANNNQFNVDPLLGPLQNNGGPTETLLPLPGSPAIDAIPLENGECSVGTQIDQRGVERPVGEGCDIGAVEAQFTNVVLTLSADPNPAPLNASVSIDVAVTGTNLDPSILDGVGVTLTGLNGDQTITLDDDAEGSLPSSIGCWSQYGRAEVLRVRIELN